MPLKGTKVFLIGVRLGTLRRNEKQMKPIQTPNHSRSSSHEGNVVTKTITAVIAAGAISAFSISGAYLLVTQLQPIPNQNENITAEYCGDPGDGDSPKININTCGEDKDGGGGNLIDA